MPPVFQSYLDNYKNEKVENMMMCLKMDMFDAAFAEMDDSVLLHSIPEKSVFLADEGTSDEYWYGKDMFSKSKVQSELSYLEQKAAFMNVCEAIDIYKNPERQHLFVKSRVIAGAPGSGKSYMLSYAVLYALQKGMRVGMTEMMAKRANILGGIYMHKLFKFPCKKQLNLHRVAELACMSLMKNP